MYERLIPLPVRWMSVRSGEVDLSTADGRLMAGVLAQFDAAESERIAERVSRAAQQRAAKGQFYGGRPAFGYQLIKNPAGRVVAWEEHHEHAAWLREAADRVLGGESLYSITKSWNELGRTSSNGARWQRRTLGRMLTAPAIAGLRETSDGELVKAQWKPILNRRTWNRLNSLISDPSRSKPFAPGHSTARKYPLSGLLVCANCETPMYHQSLGAGNRTYVCSSVANGGCGQVRIKAEPVEALVQEAAFHALDTPGVRRGPSKSKSVTTDEEDRLRRSLVEDGERLSRVDDDHYDGLLDRAAWQRQRTRIEERIRDAEKRLAELTQSVVTGSIPKGKALRDAYAEHTPDWQHSLLRVVIDRVRIAGHPKGVATTLTRRKTETIEKWEARRQAHLEEVLDRRVEIRWCV